MGSNSFGVTYEDIVREELNGESGRALTILERYGRTFSFNVVTAIQFAVMWGKLTEVLDYLEKYLDATPCSASSNQPDVVPTENMFKKLFAEYRVRS